MDNIEDFSSFTFLVCNGNRLLFYFFSHKTNTIFPCTSSQYPCFSQVRSPLRSLAFVFQILSYIAIPTHSKIFTFIVEYRRFRVRVPVTTKQVLTAPLPNARQQLWVSLILRDDQMHITVGVARLKDPQCSSHECRAQMNHFTRVRCIFRENVSRVCLLLSAYQDEALILTIWSDELGK